MVVSRTIFWPGAVILWDLVISLGFIKATKQTNSDIMNTIFYLPSNLALDKKATKVNHLAKCQIFTRVFEGKKTLHFKKRQSHLKVKVQGRHHVCIVRKALQGFTSVRICIFFSENLISTHVLHVIWLKNSKGHNYLLFSLWGNNQLHNSCHWSPSLTGNWDT